MDEHHVDSRLRGNDIPLPPGTPIALLTTWIPACAGMTDPGRALHRPSPADVDSRLRGNDRPWTSPPSAFTSGRGFPPARE